MRFVRRYRYRNHHLEPRELHALLAVIVSACFFLLLCATNLPAKPTTPHAQGRETVMSVSAQAGTCHVSAACRYGIGRE